MTIPILMLHYIESGNLKGVGDWSISNAKFSVLLDCIEEKRLKTITFAEFEASAQTIDTKNSVIITFDDCPKNLFDFVVPELIRRKMKAVFYVPTAYIDSYNAWDVNEQGFDKINLIDREQIKFLAENNMEVGSHGHFHLKQSKIAVSSQKDELVYSKEILEGIIQKPIYSFAFPYGETPKQYQKLLKSFGYKYGVSIYKANTNRYALRRIVIHKTDTKKSILFKLSTSYSKLRYLLDSYLSLRKVLKR